MTSDGRSGALRVMSLLFVGIGASAAGLILASTVGHQIALAVGTPPAWFQGDVVDPRAARVAMALHVLFMASVFFGLGRLMPKVAHGKLMAALALANPLTIVAGFLLYRVLPLNPEPAYVGPACFVVAVAAFPLFGLAVFAGRRRS